MADFTESQADARQNLQGAQSEFRADVEKMRPFQFGEFFAGYAGFSATMEELGGEAVRVSRPLDGFEGWDILTDDGLQQGLDLCDRLDHGHMAPPCRTYTRARRSDEHGVVKVLRSDTKPEGWGDPEAEEANKIVARMILLVLRLTERGSTWSIENPWDSFIWMLKCMARLFRIPGAELVLLHQCPYGAVTQKATGILTTSSWMKKVCALCHEVGAHYHLKGGLVGMTWSYLEDKFVWRTSLAAEYPCGLTVAWTRALLEWLESEEGYKWMQARSYVKLGRWKNTLALAGTLPQKRKTTGPTRIETIAERRERENVEAWGGLRFAKRAVARSSLLRNVGLRIRAVMDDWMTAELVQEVQQKLEAGISEQHIDQLKIRLCKEFGVQPSQQGWPVELWRALLAAADDPEKEVLSEWMTTGFPLGIASEIKQVGVFPSTMEDTAAVEASRVEGIVLEDHLGELTNYRSFVQEVDKAQPLLDEMLDKGRAQLCHSWEEVQTEVGRAARLTKVGCIVKTKEDGTVKSRLIFDGRRSGVNGMIKCRERVTLPRISDVATGFLQLVSNNQAGFPDSYIELMALDFKDAFNMLQLRADERCYVVIKGQDDEEGWSRYYVCNCVVFGLATGPLWSRVAAAAMRLGQAVLKSHETDINCYIDDPLIVSVASSPQQHTRHLLYYTGLWLSLGLEVSWKKVHRGQELQWIGFKLSVCGPDSLDLHVELADAKRDKLLQVFDQLEQSRGMMPLQLLQYAVGVLGWLSSAIPAARPWLAILWSVITGYREPVKATTRRRKGLILVKQVENAVRWLKGLLHLSDGKVGLSKIHRWRPYAVTLLLQTDASPYGLGGVLIKQKQIIAYFSSALTAEDYKLFNATPGDPSFQSEYELLAVVVGLRSCAQIIADLGATRVILKGDNTATLNAAMNHRASSPLMAQLTAELVLEMEAQGLHAIVAQHLPGLLNTLPDKLSRPHTEAIPLELNNILRLDVPRRSQHFYRTWPNKPNAW